MSRIELIGGEGTTSRPGAPCRSRLTAGGGPLATDERRQVGGAFGDTGDGEGVCLRSSRCSRMATARLGTSGREGSGYSPLAAMTGATMLAVGSSSLERPVVVEKGICPGTHFVRATARCCFWVVSTRGWIFNHAPETGVRNSINGMEKITCPRCNWRSTVPYVSHGCDMRSVSRPGQGQQQHSDRSSWG